MIENTLNEHTTRLDIDTVSSLQTVNMVSGLVLVQPENIMMILARGAKQGGLGGSQPPPEFWMGG